MQEPTRLPSSPGATPQCEGKLDDLGRCPWVSATTIGRLSVCETHIPFAMAAQHAAQEARRVAKLRMQKTRVYDLHRETLTKPTKIPAVVYYFGNPLTQQVKIGTSTNLGSRIATLRKSYPRALILATEPGTYSMEWHRHQQFGRLRVGGEWFLKDPDLMEHVNLMRARYDILSPGRPVRLAWVAPVRRSAA